MQSQNKKALSETCPGEVAMGVYTYGKPKLLIETYTFHLAILLSGNHCKLPEGPLMFERIMLSGLIPFALISELVTPGQTTILVTVEGTVSFNNEKPNYFNQNFMLTAVDNMWKIASDCFRYIDH